MNRYFELAKIAATLAGFFMVAAGMIMSSAWNTENIWSTMSFKVSETNQAIMNTYFALLKDNPNLAESYWNSTSLVKSSDMEAFNSEMTNSIKNNMIAAYWLFSAGGLAAVLAVLFSAEGFRLAKREEKRPWRN
jgi:uncharacterized membrane protein YdcZ (DUF606 family)